jgi:hypothetical protein
MSEKNKISAAAVRKARGVMAATAGGKGRKTGYSAYESVKANRSGVAKKARAVDAATKPKRTTPKKVSTTSVGVGRVTPPTRAQMAKNRQLVGGIISAVATGGTAGLAVTGVRGLRLANAVRPTAKLSTVIKSANANAAKGLITKSEAQKIILDANIKYNRAAFAGKSPLQGINKATANKLLGKKIPPLRGNSGK